MSRNVISSRSKKKPDKMRNKLKAFVPYIHTQYNREERERKKRKYDKREHVIYHV